MIDYEFTINPVGVEEAIVDHGPLCEDQLVGVIMERFGVPVDEAKSAITDAMMDGSVYETSDGTYARTGFYGEEGWEPNDC